MGVSLQRLPYSHEAHNYMDSKRKNFNPNNNRGNIIIYTAMVSPLSFDTSLLYNTLDRNLCPSLLSVSSRICAGFSLTKNAKSMQLGELPGLG